MNDISYSNWSSMSDATLTESIGAFIQYHRLDQDKSQGDVAKAAGISRSTLSLLERGEKVTLNTLIPVLRVLDLLHIMEVFKIKNEIGPLDYAKLQKKNKKQRARSVNGGSTDDLGW